MNQKIKNSAIKAGMSCRTGAEKFGLNENMNSWQVQGFMLEDFTNIIIDECIAVVNQSDGVGDVIKITHEIKDYFGIKR